MAKAKADGYTLFGGTISTHAINASLYKNLPYDPVKDFEPISLVAFLPNVLIVDPNLGVRSVAELIALLKKDPAKRTFASSGAGTSTHLAGEMLADMIGVHADAHPYKGTPPAMLDVSSGQVTFMFDQMTAALPLVQAGKLKLLAVTTAQAHGAGARVARPWRRPACRASRWRPGRRSMRRSTCRRRSSQRLAGEIARSCSSPRCATSSPTSSAWRWWPARRPSWPR